jgi:long-subunit fatty acid transport protein
MKKLTFIVLSLMVCTSSVLAGGLVTNTNQSSAWARTLTREASLGVDAVYYNPAGLAQLGNGLHLSLSNQSIFQTRTISSDYPYLAGSPASYEAELTAPLFPSIYAAFKMDKLTISAGFNIIGGGGSADFPTGLPSFEIPVASLVPMLQGALAPIDQGYIDAGFPDTGFRNISGYNMDASFVGSSTYMGYQVGATYAINDMISVALGGRYVSAKNTYEGSLAGVTITTPSGTMAPGDYLMAVSGSPGLDAVTVATLQGTAALLDGATADASLNATQKGSGFTPIIGVNLHLTDMINIAAKYEHHTKIELENDTEIDQVGMFPDGEKTRGDLPGQFSIGAQLKPIDKISVSLGYNYFMDKGAYYGKTNEAGEQINNEASIDDNAWSLSGSVEYKFLAIMGASVGYSFGNLGVNDSYQSDLSYGLKSSTVAGGVFVHLGEMIVLNAGVVFVNYDDYTKAQSYQPMGFPAAVPFNDTYGKNTMIISLGLDVSLAR